MSHKSESECREIISDLRDLVDLTTWQYDIVGQAADCIESLLAAPPVVPPDDVYLLKREIHNLKRHIEDYCQVAQPDRELMQQAFSAIEQALDDMDEAGHCVCEAAKQLLQVSLSALRARLASPVAQPVEPIALTEYAWLVENGKQGSELRYRTFEQGMPEWTPDHNKAIRYARREDAEMAHAEDEDAWRITEHGWDVAPPSMQAPIKPEPLPRYLTFALCRTLQAKGWQFNGEGNASDSVHEAAVKAHFLKHEHPNLNVPIDPACSKKLDELGDDRGQGLDGYWKWGFRAGWHYAGLQAPKEQDKPKPGDEPTAWKQLQALKNPYGHCAVSSHAWDMAIIQAMRVVLAERQAAVPAGFALVPIDPTPQMLAHAIKPRYSYSTDMAFEAAIIYRTMLAAAPSAPVGRVSEQAVQSEAFRKHLQMCSDKVAAWPSWKKRADEQVVQPALTESEIATAYLESQGQTLREQDHTRITSFARAIERHVRSGEQAVRDNALEDAAALVDDYWGAWSMLPPEKSKSIANFFSRNIRRLKSAPIAPKEQI